jgi:hypothetical protein
MSVFDIVAWVFIALGALLVAWGLVALAFGPAWARRPRPGAHAALSPLGDPAKRRKLWREFQAPLVLIMDGVIILTVDWGELVRLLLVAILTLLVPVWDLARWARSRARAKAAGATADSPAA